MLKERSARQESSHLVSAKHVRELARLAGDRNIEVGLRTAECFVIEETQGYGGDVAGARCALLLHVEIEEIGLEFLVRDSVWRSIVVACELRHGL
jgi:hypothetical protein